MDLDRLRALLADYPEAWLAPLLEAGLQSADETGLRLQLPIPCGRWAPVLAGQLARHLAPAFAASPRVEIDWAVAGQPVQGALKPLPGIKNIIAVASGKGGVGKSTVTANLALALAAEGASVGVLDADIYGPSQPQMLGVAGQRPQIIDNRAMRPVAAHGIVLNSIGLLIDPGDPTIWRGPMVTQALQQLLAETQWPELDYLLIDLPPGTGDTQLSLAQRIPVSGAVIVTTPQEIALLDARKGLRMFEKVGISVLGIVENMAGHVCSHCGHLDEVFAAGGAARLGAETGVPVLGALPLDGAIRAQADGGAPTVVAAPESEAATRYLQIARRAAAELVRAGDADFPEIVIETESPPA